jgi:tetratricopeptide (TPR) repeat protein
MLAEAVQAYRQALTVFTRDALLQDWAMSQNNLGAALQSLGEREGGAEGTRRLAEAVEAFRQAFTVYTRDALPQYWAAIQNNLGNTLRSLGERQGGAEGARRLAEAVQAYQQALTVFTRDVLPYYWASTQINLGRVLQVQIGQDGFAKGLELVDRLSRAEGIRDDPVAQASLRTLALVCQVATGHGEEARRTFGSLVALVERQPDDFRLVWEWTPLRKLVAESKAPSVSAHREGLQELIDAVARDNKAAILAGLKEVQDRLISRGDEPGR